MTRDFMVIAMRAGELTQSYQKSNDMLPHSF